MRVNVYAEEMTNQVEIISKTTKDGEFTGLRFWLHLPVTVKGKHVKGPFMHFPGDDDSSAVTFWGKRDMRKLLKKALKCLDKHYEAKKWQLPPRATRLKILSKSQKASKYHSGRTSMVSRPGLYLGRGVWSLGTRGKGSRSNRPNGS